MALATALGDGCAWLGVVLVCVFGVVVGRVGVVGVVAVCVAGVGVGVVCARVVVGDVAVGLGVVFGVVLGEVPVVVGTVMVSGALAAPVVVWTCGRVSAVAVGVVALFGVEERVVVSADLCEPPQPAINSAAATTAAGDTSFWATLPLWCNKRPGRLQPSGFALP